MKQKLWFKRKTYGWGWTPSTWEGWLLIALYLALVFLSIPIFGDDWLKSMLCIVALTVALIYICYKTGESPRWQWGQPKNETI